MDVIHLEVDDPRWGEALGRLRHDFYHLPEYVKLDSERSHAQPRAFLAISGDAELFVPYLLRRCDSLFPDSDVDEDDQVYDVVSPYGYPGVLLSDAARRSLEFAQQAMHQFSETLRKQGVCSAFLLMNPLLSDGLPQLFGAPLLTTIGETVAMDLTVSDAELWKGIREGHQATIKKATKAGFAARMVPLHEHIECVMDIYRQTMDRVGARDAYYFDRSYFARLAEMPDKVHCCVVETGGQQAAACIFLECCGIVQAHLGGTGSAFLNRSPFHLLLYHAAGWAKSRGNRYLHLGSGVGGSNDPLFQFKRGFSRRLFPLLALRLITDDKKYHDLVTRRAQAAHVTVDKLMSLDFFPVYRAPFEKAD
jgi:Acetyltransferase (GNAT) domain